MSCDLIELCIDANNPAQLAAFWSGVLGWPTGADADGSALVIPDDDTGFQLRFLPTTEPKLGPNQMHFDLTSTSLDDQQATVDRALALGGRHLDVGQLPEDPHVVLADPDGNEFCVIEPGNNFLADCGTIGALASDGSQAVGYFWTRALGWPLVWDQDQETAVRSPRGGPKITWGGPPVRPKIRRNRLHFHLGPAAGNAWQATIDQLIAVGATRLDPSLDHRGAVALADPDGNEFCLLPPR